MVFHVTIVMTTLYKYYMNFSQTESYTIYLTDHTSQDKTEFHQNVQIVT